MISFSRLTISPDVRGVVCALHRVDLDDDDVVGFRRLQERKHRRVAHVAAVPVRHAVDLDGAKQQRQRRRRHHHVRVDLVAREDVRAAGVHVGGGNEQFEFAAAHRVEIDEAVDQVAQRIDVQRIEIVGREIARHRLEPALHRRSRKRQQREQPVGDRALHWRQVAARAGRAPERGEPLARLLRAAAREPVGDHHGVDGAGRCAGNAGDLQPAVGEQMIGDAPGERAVRAAALQREVDLLLAALRPLARPASKRRFVRPSR